MITCSCNILHSQAFITRWNIPINDKTATIQTTGNGYDYDVNWGDGNHSYNVNGDITHNYEQSGTYHIEITRDFPRIYFNDEGDKLKIRRIYQWGNIQWKNFHASFMGCSNLAGQAIDKPNLAEVQDMSFAFFNASSFQYYMDDWDVSSIENMTYMFCGATTFNSPLNSWDMANVEFITGMFQNATSFNQDLNSWDVSKVKKLDFVFWNAQKFNGDISNWNTGNTLSMKGTFKDARSFNRSIGQWNVSRVKDMWSLFADARVFNQSISQWSVDSVQVMNLMFYQADAFNRNISNWNVGQVNDMAFMFQGTDLFNQDLSSWDVSNVLTMNKMFSGAKRFNQNLGNWNLNESIILTKILDDSGLCIENYDLTLVGWSELNLMNKILGCAQMFYCESDSVRSDLINNNWVFLGDGQDCSNDNYWLNLTGTGSWFDHPINWSKGHFPKECENIILEESISLTIGSNDSIIVNTIHTMNGATLIIKDGGYLKQLNN